MSSIVGRLMRSNGCLWRVEVSSRSTLLTNLVGCNCIKVLTWLGHALSERGCSLVKLDQSVPYLGALVRMRPQQLLSRQKVVNALIKDVVSFSCFHGVAVFAQSLNLYASNWLLLYGWITVILVNLLICLLTLHVKHLELMNLPQFSLVKQTEDLGKFLLLVQGLLN